MAGPITKTVTTKDQERYLVNKLLERSYNKLVMDAVCDNLTMREGSGDTAYMTRYKRMSVPVEKLEEGVTPVASEFSLEEVSVQLDQWGDFVVLTDVALLTTKHPLMEQARILLADNAARVLDREITLVLMAGTNIQYFDGSRASRAAVLNTDIMSSEVISKAVINLTMGGASPIGGMRQDSKQNSSPNYNAGLEYIGIIGPHIKFELLRPNVNFGSLIQNNVYNQKGSGVTTGAVGKYMGVLFIETNFIPVYTLFGNKTAAIATGVAPQGLTGVTLATSAAGTLTPTHVHGIKIVRRNKLRGFPENVSMCKTHTLAALQTRMTFTFDSNYYYDLYVSANGLTADSDLKLVGVGYTGEVVHVDALPTSTITAPANIGVAGGTDPSAVHVIFITGEGAVAWAGFYKPRFYVSPAGATNVDPLDQRRTVGFKFYGKSVIKNNDFMLRIELACTFAAPFA